jgi:hypothetical protein
MRQIRRLLIAADGKLATTREMIGPNHGQSGARAAGCCRPDGLRDRQSLQGSWHQRCQGPQWVGFLAEIHALGIDLFLHQQGLDTTTPAGKALFQMMGVFAEFERSILQERIRAGIARARQEGKHRPGQAGTHRGRAEDCCRLWGFQRDSAEPDSPFRGRKRKRVKRRT